MVNNKISYELCAAAEAAENGVRRTWSPEQYREYAAKLDRLVETTRKLVEDADGDDPDYLTVTPALVEAVVSALSEIELTKEPK